MRIVHVFLFVLFCGLAGSGCRGLATRSAVRTISAMMADGLPAYTREETDVELATQALAANVKFIEALLQTEPRHPTLLLQAAQGFATYAYAVVEGQLAEARAAAPSHVARHQQRAQQLYRRGQQYGLRLLHRYHAAWRQAPSLPLATLTAHLQQLPPEAVPALFWTAFCWGGREWH